MPNEPRSLVDAGREVLHRRFGMATERLEEREILLSFDAAVIDWLVGQSEWQTSHDPLRTLDHLWHNLVADPIMQLILDKKLGARDFLLVAVRESGPCSTLSFIISSPPI